MRLTAIALAKLKPSATRQEIADAAFPGLSGRLRFVLQPSGKASWIIRFRLHGKPGKHTLGHYPTLTLAEARRRAHEALSLVAQGKDPRGIVRRVAGPGKLFGTVAREFIQRHAQARNRRWLEQARLLGLRPDPDTGELTPIPGGLCEQWGSLRLADVTRRDIIDVLDTLAADAPIAANRQLAALRKMFNWAVGRDEISGSPCAGIAAPSPERSRERVLGDAEIRQLWQACELEGFPFGHIT